MVETIVYKNHLSETFNFGANGAFLNESELHDYSWNVTKKNNMIAAFDYAVSARKLSVIIICASEAEGIARRNALFEVTEKDVLAMQYGRLYIGDYYFKCYVQKSVKKNYLASKRYMTVTLTLVTDAPYWVKETSKVFAPEVVVDLWERKAFFMSGSNVGKETDANNRIADLTYYSTAEKEVKVTPDSLVKYAVFSYDEDKAYLGWSGWCQSAAYTLTEGAAFFRVEAAYKDDREITDDNIAALKTVAVVCDKGTGTAGCTGVGYPHGYPFDYGSDTVAQTIVNGGIVASSFRLTINGPCIDPAVSIAGHVYQVNTTVAEGQYLLIDSAAKTVTLQANDGTQTNVFNARNKDSYIFQEIPAGVNIVSWTGDFAFEVTLLEERSEPKWT